MTRYRGIFLFSMFLCLAVFVTFWSIKDKVQAFMGFAATSSNNLSLEELAIEHKELLIVQRVFELTGDDRHEEALDFLNTALSSHQHSQELIGSLLVSTFGMLEEQGKDEANYKNAEDVLDVTAYVKIARSLKVLGSKQKALEVLLKGISKDSTSPELWLEIAHLESSSGRPNEALDVFNEVLRLNKNNVAALYGIAKLVLDDSKASPQELRLALMRIQKAINLNPKVVDFFQVKSQLHLKLGEVKQAKKVLQKAIEIEPGNLVLKEEIKKLP